MLATLLLLAGLSHASSLKLLEDGGDPTVKASWEDAKGKDHKVSATVSRAHLEEARNNPLVFDLDPIYADTARAIRAWAKEKGHKVKVTTNGKGIRITARNRKVLDAAARVRDEALKDAMTKHRLRLMESGGLTADHPAIARDAADDVADLARAIARDSDDPRVFADAAISFVQSIPYKAGGAKGVKLPLRVLDLGSGDCDSKSTLFLALMRARHPDVRTAMVYVKGHAFVALGLDPKKGDHTVREKGATWVLAEPVGPRIEDVGWASFRSRWKMRWHGELVEVPT
jgi:hypothetical protein